MHISRNKSFALLVGLTCIGMQQVDAKPSFVENVRAVENKGITTGDLFRDHVVHTLAHELTKENLPDSVLFEIGSAKLHAHEVWETLASMLIEYMYERYVVLNGKPKETAQLVALGAVANKFVEEVWSTLGLHTYFSDTVKKQYKKYGKSLVRTVLATELHQRFTKDS